MRYFSQEGQCNTPSGCITSFRKMYIKKNPYTWKVLSAIRLQSPWPGDPRGVQNGLARASVGVDC